ncbi:MAG: hypothetical protein EZS28_011092, partial [Streblomastix strix]
MPIHIEQHEFSVVRPIKDMYDKSSAVQVVVSGKLNMLDCEFQGTYVFDNYANESASNKALPEDIESHIDEFIKLFAKSILVAFGSVGQTIGKDLDIAGSFLNYGNGADKYGQFRQDFDNEKNSRKYIHSLYENIHKFDTSAVSIPLDDLLIFSAFTDYPNGLFDDLKIKLEINPHAFVFCQVNPTISMAKYQTMNKDELLDCSRQKLMDIDLMFRNWSLTFQYTKQFLQLGCTADFITGLHTEPLTESGLKNLICDIKPVIMSIKNYVITEVTANMAGYKATDVCLNRIRQFYSQRPFVVPTQLVEIWPFPTSATLTGIRTSQIIPLYHVTDFCLLFSKDARATTCFENLCYQNMQVTTCGRNFPNMSLNTLDQQFFQLQLNASNLDLNSNGPITFDRLQTQNKITSVELRGEPIYQEATDSYFNINTSGKRPPPPIICTIQDTFWLFSPAASGS